MEITQEHIDAALAAGACSVDYPPGTPVEDICQNDLIWAEANVPKLAQSISDVPLFALSGCGYGSGSGYGSGYGYGCGYGCGSGYGHGYGEGDGFGYGCQ